MYTVGIKVSWDSSSEKTVIIAKNMSLTPSKGVLLKKKILKGTLPDYLEVSR